MKKDERSTLLTAIGSKKKQIFAEKWCKFCELEKSLYICTLERGIGLMAEWLGTALQKLLQRVESASDLQERYL